MVEIDNDPNSILYLYHMFIGFGMLNFASLTRWLHRRNDLRGAKTLAREGLKRDAQDNAEGFLKLGIILLEEGNFPTAERVFRTAIKGQPTDPDPNLYLVVLLERQGDIIKAETVCRHAIGAVPGLSLASENYYLAKNCFVTKSCERYTNLRNAS